MDTQKPFSDKEVLEWQAGAPWRNPIKCLCYRCSHEVHIVFEGSRTENEEC